MPGIQPDPVAMASLSAFFARECPESAALAEVVFTAHPAALNDLAFWRRAKTDPELCRAALAAHELGAAAGLIAFLKKHLDPAVFA